MFSTARAEETWETKRPCAPSTLPLMGAWPSKLIIAGSEPKAVRKIAQRLSRVILYYAHQLQRDTEKPSDPP